MLVMLYLEIAVSDKFKFQLFTELSFLFVYNFILNVIYKFIFKWFVQDYVTSKPRDFVHSFICC